jgi:hypothetical protein
VPRDPIARLAKKYRGRHAGEIHLGQKLDGGECTITLADLDTHAHLCGPTRSGKTKCMQRIAKALIDARDRALFLLDPHDGPPPKGGLFHALKSYCYETGQEDRLIVVDPEDIFTHSYAVGFNPLTHGRDPAVQAAFGVDHLRTVVGDDAVFAQTPMLARWAFNLHVGLIVPNLTMRDATRVLALNDGTYRSILADTLPAPDYDEVRDDWRWLTEREDRVRNILDDKLGSTTNRVRGYVSGKSLRYMLSTRRHALDIDAAIRERKIVLVNISRRGVLVPDWQRMFGIQFVHAVCNSAMNRTDDSFTPAYLMVDEFHHFLSPTVLDILDGAAKFGLHLLLAHQHLGQLIEASTQDPRYYKSVMTNARLKIIFGGLPDEDADQFTRHVYGASYDVEKIKPGSQLYGEVQTQRFKWFDIIARSNSLTVSQTKGKGSAVMDADTVSHSDSVNSGRNSGRSRGRAAARGQHDDWARGDSTSVGFDGMNANPTMFLQSYSNVLGGGASSADIDSEGDSEGESSGVGSTDGDAHTQARTQNEFEADTVGTTRGETVTRVPMVVPDPPRLELRSQEFERIEDQHYRQYQRMRNLPRRQAVLSKEDSDPVEFRTAYEPDAEHTIQSIRAEDYDLLRQLPCAGTLKQIDDESRERDVDFRKRARSKAKPSSAKRRVEQSTLDPKWEPPPKLEKKPKAKKPPPKQDPDLTAQS